MRVLRIYHAGRDAAHRERDRALTRAGVEVTLVVPRSWPEPGAVTAEAFEVVELDVRHPGDVNRHTYANADALRDLVVRVRPDVIDVHEEPYSAVLHQVLRQVLPAAPPSTPVIGYTAQNLDKRFPPPFAGWERASLARLAALYPCSRQAASVARGKGFAGPISVLPLGVDTSLLRPGAVGAVRSEPFTLGLVGRVEAHKGALDAVRVLAAVRATVPARLLVIGQGAALTDVQQLARQLDVSHAVEYLPWLPAAELAAQYRRMDVLLVPSRATRTWTEQFGRVVVEARACGVVTAGYRCGALPEVVGTAGVLVPEGDVTALTVAVRGLVDPAIRVAALRDATVASWDEVARELAALYERVRSGVPASPALTGRWAALAEFGPPARVDGPARPFALPGLREDNAVTRVLARTADALDAHRPFGRRG
jgi:glycosyltransferase involved in cell wall biosynthesis